jgi:Glycosyl transferase family 2
LLPCRIVQTVGSPSVSVVVEWENILLAKAERSRAMLRQLVQEAKEVVERGAVRGPIELLVCFDAGAVDGPALAADLASELDGHDALAWRLVPVDAGEYYELKNAGATETAGDVIVFLDSDVIPEPGWLSSLIEPFADESIGVVAGNSYLEPQGFYGKTFALAWFFPLRATEARVEPARKFFANNVAFRREVFERFPFPTLDDASRGSCWRLAQILTANGVTMVRSTGAQVSHPAPNGYRHFLARGLAQGRDRLLEERAWGSRRTRSPLGTASRLKRDLKRSTTAITRDFKQVGLNGRAVPAALGLSTSYYLLCTLGEVATMVSPSAMARHFRI